MEIKGKADNFKNLRENTIAYVPAELFLNNGIEAVKMTDVADASQTGVATVYRYFGTKEALVVKAGILLWQDLRRLVENDYSSTEFKCRNGYDQLYALYHSFLKVIKDHTNFIRFIGDFDAYVIRKSIPKEMLAGYETSIHDFYPVFYESFKRGVEDGSVRDDIDPLVFYNTANHAMMALSQKILRGEIISDDKPGDILEIEVLEEIIIQYIKK